MGVHLHIRNLPDDLRQTLCQRAASRGQSLRKYVLELLEEHCSRPTTNEWLDGLSRLAPVVLDFPGADAVREARDADEAALLDALDFWLPDCG